MKITEPIKIPEKTEDHIIGYKCDKCKKDYLASDNNDNGIYELQEFLHIDYHGGYGTVFEDGIDGIKIKADICQHCVEKAFGDCIRVEK